MAQHGAALYRNFRAYQVFGANTNVGKTIFSTLLSRAASQDDKQKVWYLKPVSTGPLQDADKSHLQRFAPGVTTQNFYQFKEPVSPHLAAEVEVPDASLVAQTASQIQSNAKAGRGFMLVETAGGPHSPGPSGTSQADLYRPLRLPLLLVADAHLGGISTSVSSYESLRIRGYDVDGVAMFQEHVYKNSGYLEEYFHDKRIPFLSVAEPPAPHQQVEQDQAAMDEYYSSLDKSSDVSSFMTGLSDTHDSRVERVENLAHRAFSRVWWPFAQHSELSAESLNTIDSAHGDYFQTFTRPRPDRKDQDANLLQPTVDGSASWWTQGLGHANSKLTLSAAYAAGRYGHVMFANSVNEPAVELADRLLTTLNNPRLRRVFFSDNGSSAMEIAVKMALKAACDRYGFSPSKDQVDILGYKNSYHGDTIGSMDMSEPSVYNEKVPWYRGKGFWFDCPSIKMRKGQWLVEKPAGLVDELGPTSEFASLQDIYGAARDQSPEAERYKSYIRKTLEHLTQVEKRKFGALVFEPLILGAGGMVLADPLFQRVLVNEVRASAHLFASSGSDSGVAQSASSGQDSGAESVAWTGLPVVADEIFTGLYRLGHPHACELLNINADISSHGKLLTGGLLPLALTTASESIFDAFVSNDKSDALLHGHSYTAHAIGCSVANSSLQQMEDLAASGEWDAFKSDWSGSSSILGQLKTALGDIAKTKPVLMKADGSVKEELQVWSKWSQSFVTDLSNYTQRVESVWAHGSVLAISITDGSGKGGYTSTAAITLRDKLYEGVNGWNMHARVLGNVLYLITSQVAPEAEVRKWEERVKQALGM